MSYDYSDLVDEWVRFQGLNPYWEDAGLLPRHQIGGWSAPIQGPVEHGCVSIVDDMDQADVARLVSVGDPTDVLAWRPLLQLRDIPELELEWSDSGSMFFDVLSDDIDDRTIDATVLVEQSG